MFKTLDVTKAMNSAEIKTTKYNNKNHRRQTVSLKLLLIFKFAFEGFSLCYTGKISHTSKSEFIITSNLFF